VLVPIVFGELGFLPLPGVPHESEPAPGVVIEEQFSNVPIGEGADDSILVKIETRQFVHKFGLFAVGVLVNPNFVEVGHQVVVYRVRGFRHFPPIDMRENVRDRLHALIPARVPFGLGHFIEGSTQLLANA